MAFKIYGMWLPGWKVLSMEFEIIKVHNFKKSQTKGTYLMVEMSDIKNKKWYRTYLVPSYRNYNRWKRVAKIGNIVRIKNLEMKRDNIISADSIPELANGKLAGAGQKLTLQELSRLGVFGVFIFIIWL